MGIRLAPRDARIGVQHGWLVLRQGRICLDRKMNPQRRKGLVEDVRLARKYLRRKRNTTVKLAAGKRTRQAVEQRLRRGLQALIERKLLVSAEGPLPRNGKPWKPKAYEALRKAVEELRSDA